ncbi:MAG TPA: ethylbenzene dehydrogenase-related protein [Blastocatellia bacterium]|nr:ethylbenzene dehydrogenase-related protein [Blastocatellia bacterium]
MSEYRRSIAPIVVLSLLVVSSCRKSPVLTPEVVAISAASVPLDPGDRAWDNVSEHLEPLVLQDLVEPRLMEASTPAVRVRAITNGEEIAFRIEWPDSTRDDLPGPAHFVDACAVQVPSVVEASVPAPQMGEVGKGVEIAYWRADWQAALDGREDTIRSIYPNASVDHYPFDAPSLEKGSDAQKEMSTRYAPAAAVGNRRVGPRESSVEDLLAEGPGTLSRAPQAGSKGRGLRTEAGWSVVILRRMPNGLAPGVRSQVAFAVWEGAHGEVGARKMRTGWVPLMMQR